MRDEERMDAPVNPPIRPVPPAVLLLFILTGVALNWLIPLDLRFFPSRVKASWSGLSL